MRNVEEQEATLAFKNSVDALKAAVPLADYAARHMTLKRQGSLYVALCPFHEERSESFTIYPDDNHYHCFGCEVHGDVLDLHMHLYDHLDKWTALVEVALEWGVELPARSQRWRDGTVRKADYIEAAHQVAGEVLCRRLYKILVLPFVDAIADPDERERELQRTWRGWQTSLNWKQHAAELSRGDPTLLRAIAKVYAQGPNEETPR